MSNLYNSATSVTFIELLKKTIEEECIDGTTVRKYSGRGMMGDHCIAVGFEDSGGEVSFLIRLAKQIVADVMGGTTPVREVEDTIHEQFDDLIKISKRMRVDSMGRGSIIYWPTMKWPDGVNKSEEEED